MLSRYGHATQEKCVKTIVTMPASLTQKNEGERSIKCRGAFFLRYVTNTAMERKERRRGTIVASV